MPGADPYPDAAGVPTVEAARPVGVSLVDDDARMPTPVGERAHEARVHAHVHEATAGAQRPGDLAQHGRVVGHVGARQHAHRGWQRRVDERQGGRVAPRHRQPPARVPQLPSGQVHAHRRPTQTGGYGRVRTGAAADVEADTLAWAEVSTVRAPGGDSHPRPR